MSEACLDRPYECPDAENGCVKVFALTGRFFNLNLLKIPLYI